MKKLIFLTAITLYLLIFIIPIVVIYINDYSDIIREFELHVVFFLLSYYTYFFSIIFSSIIYFIFAGARRKISNYTDLEEFLIVHKKEKILNDLKQYHSQFKWGNYAPLIVASFTISVIFILENDNILNIGLNRIFIDIFFILLGFSSLILVVVDLIHVNTQSPVVTAKLRFQLTRISVLFGGNSISALILSVIVLACLYNVFYAFFFSIAASILNFFFILIRGIPIIELKREFNFDLNEYKKSRNKD